MSFCLCTCHDFPRGQATCITGGHFSQQHEERLLLDRIIISYGNTEKETGMKRTVLNWTSVYAVESEDDLQRSLGQYNLHNTTELFGSGIWAWKILYWKK